MSAKVAGSRLQQAEFGADEGEGGEGGGFGAEDARAEVGEGEGVVAKPIALGGRPAALGAEREHDRSIIQNITRRERGGGFVVVEDEAGGGNGGGGCGDEFGEGAAVGDDGETGVEGLFGPDNHVAAPIAGGPERAVRVVGIAFFGGDEVEGGDAERGGVAEDVARGLRSGETEDEGDGRGRGRRCGVPREGEREGGGGEGGERGFAAGAVDQTAIEGVADGAAEHGEHVHGARVGARERGGGFGGGEEDEIHGAGNRENMDCRRRVAR